MLKLNVYAPCNNLLGYGHVGLNLMKALYTCGVDISFFPIGGLHLTTNDRNLVQHWINNQNNFDYNAPCLKIWHEHDLATKVGNGKYYTLSFFELDTLNQRRCHHLNYSDHIITPSHWGKQILEKNNITRPISVVPMGVDLSIFSPSYTLPNDNFVFLVIGKWEIRKGHDLLPEIFSKAFKYNDNVEFWMMCDNPFLSNKEEQEWRNYYTQSKIGNCVKFISQVNTDIEFANIINKADCLISLSRAEGFDLPILQAMACGKHIITTNYSAHTEYCNHNNSFLIDVDEVEEAYDGKFFGEASNNCGNWAKLTDKHINQCVNYMQDIKHTRDHFENCNEEGMRMAHKLTWKKCGKKVKDIIFNAYDN